MKLLSVSDSFTWKLLRALWKENSNQNFIFRRRLTDQTHTFLVLNHDPLSALLAWMLFYIYPCFPMWHWRKQSLVCNCLKHKHVPSLAAFLPSVIFPLLYQFKLLPELFQDEEKAISPTSATPSGRVPLSRTPVKPAKARPGQTSKEHKKTVGHQVSLRLQLY